VRDQPGAEDGRARQQQAGVGPAPAAQAAEDVLEAVDGDVVVAVVGGELADEREDECERERAE